MQLEGSNVVKELSASRIGGLGCRLIAQNTSLAWNSDSDGLPVCKFWI